MELNEPLTSPLAKLWLQQLPAGRQVSAEWPGWRWPADTRQLRSQKMQNAEWTHRYRTARPEGWTFYTEPLPQFKGLNIPGSAESSYYGWVDQFNASGLGENTPINTGNESEGVLALKDGKWVVLRVPYPLGFYSKWMGGRIDVLMPDGKTAESGRP